MLISHQGHTDTIQVCSVTVMTHVKALQAGHSSQGTYEPTQQAQLRWIHVMAWRCFHVDIWFYLKIESTSGFPRWFHVIFSTLIPRVFHVESTCFQRWTNVMFSTLNQRQDPTWFPRWYLVLYESWFHVQFSTLNLRNVLNVEST